MTSTTNPRSSAVNDLIDLAATRGIIDASQRDRLRALADELASSSASVSPNEPRAEVRRGFNAITVAYSLGALLVLFALAWFLLERWNALGAGGVLIVAALYAATFAGVGIALRRRGFVTAGGIAITLAVAMTPVWSWALLALAGEAPDPRAWDNALARYEPFAASRFIIYELATIGVGLATVRHVRFFGIGAAIAAAFIALLMHLGQALGDPRLAWYVGPYYTCVVACATLAVAYGTERRQPAGEDYAFWFYLGGAGMLVVGYVSVWSHIGAWRHALPLVAAAFVVAALYLRRRTLLVAGGLFAFGYLGYLAFDVFKRMVALPIALASLGLIVIVATVWMQRRFPALVERVSGSDDSGRKTLPAGPIFVLGPLVIAATATLFASMEARDRTAEQDWQRMIYQKRARHAVPSRKPGGEPPLPRPARPVSNGPNPPRN